MVMLVPLRAALMLDGNSARLAPDMVGVLVGSDMAR
jgi:hypothetical protein